MTLLTKELSFPASHDLILENFWGKCQLLSYVHQILNQDFYQVHMGKSLRCIRYSAVTKHSEYQKFK